MKNTPRPQTPQSRLKSGITPGGRAYKAVRYKVTPTPSVDLTSRAIRTKTTITDGKGVTSRKMTFSSGDSSKDRGHWSKPISKGPTTKARNKVKK